MLGWGSRPPRAGPDHIPWDEERMEPDIDAAASMIRKEEPTVALFGQSVFLFPTPLEELAEAAHEVGATVMYDAAHVMGLVAGGQFQDPLREGADVMTGSSHKTFPGPQGGFVISDSEDEKLHRRLNSGIFPGSARLTTCTTLPARQSHYRSSRSSETRMPQISSQMHRH